MRFQVSSSVSCSPKWSINTSQLQFCTELPLVKVPHIRALPLTQQICTDSPTRLQPCHVLTRHQTRDQQVTVHTGKSPRLFGRNRNKRASSQVVRLLTKNIVVAKGFGFLGFSGQNPTCNVLLFLKIMHRSPATRHFLHYLK